MIKTLQVYIYLVLLAIALLLLKGEILELSESHFLIGLGLLGLWRWGWWLVHVIRSVIYRFWSYKRTARAAANIWQSGWRPEEVVFMMTTYKEQEFITIAVLNSIIDEITDLGIPARLFVGTGDPFDEVVIDRFMAQLAPHHPRPEVICVRQIGTGKRMAIGTVLRDMEIRGIADDTPVVFMDGDTVLENSCLRKCLPLFKLKPKLDALTTNERAILKGAPWMQHWLDLRFAQRHFGMLSHALSNKVLTLTGRMSVFRAKHVVNPGFYQIVENDSLNHWLWGKFRFLSGDDKSTWYYLLRQGTEMTYVPDAMVTTIEIIEGSGVERMKANLLRWSGNMLRNGSRAIALGPRKVGPFIWWCLIDQRISIWTVLAGPILAIMAAITVTPKALLLFALWILFSRLIASLVLSLYGDKFNIIYPFILYFSQILNAIVKVYIWFRLPNQKWSNRGNHGSAKKSDLISVFRNGMAAYLTSLYMAIFILILALIYGVIEFSLGPGESIKLLAGITAP